MLSVCVKDRKRETHRRPLRWLSLIWGPANEESGSKVPEIFRKKPNFEMSVQTQHKPERVESSARHTAVKFQERLLKYANQLTTAKVTAGI